MDVGLNDNKLIPIYFVFQGRSNYLQYSNEEASSQ